MPCQPRLILKKVVFQRVEFFVAVCIASLLFTQRLIAQPIINSFAPTSGMVGTAVTISGANFSGVPANNGVFFGAVKATVIAATTTTLSVTVPAGTSYQPISISVGGLTAYSRNVFVQTYPGGNNLQQGPTFNQFIFGRPAADTTGLHPQSITICDFDGDGKPDMATANFFNTTGVPGSISVLRNVSTTSAISFATKQDFPMGSFAYGITSGDLDGDGKPDLVATSITEQALSVFRNASTPGAITFSTRTIYPTGNNPYCVALGDLDGDGKPDLVVSNYLSSSFSIFRNTSTVGNIAFLPKVDVMTALEPEAIAIGDFDGDGKPDIAVVSESSNTLQLFRNTSSVGQISFAAAVSFQTGSQPYSVAVGDLDGDGKPDLAVVNNGANTMSVFRNISTAGTMALAPKTDYPTGAFASNVAIADLNGDGKPDLAVSSANTTFYQNSSFPGTISLSTPIYLDAVTNPYMAAISDFDLDGKPDLALTNNLGTIVSVLRNVDNEPTVQNFSPTSAPANGSVTITGVNFTAASSVQFGGVTAGSFSIVNADTIIAVVGSGISGAVTVTNPYGVGAQQGFVFEGPPIITAITPAAAGIGVTVNIAGANLTGPTAVSFGGIAAASFTVTSPTNIAAVVGSGATGQVSVTTPYGNAILPGFTLIPPPQIQSFSPDSAILGQTVTIIGSNFNTSSAVTFGGVPASAFSVISSTEILATVGNGATGDVNVISDGGTGVYSGFTFLPPPSISAVSPDSGSTGTQITIMGNNFTNVSSVSFGGVPATSFAYLSPTEIVAVPAAGASGNIVVTTPFGSGSWAGFTYTPVITINSFAPVSAGTGAVVTITGSNFDGVTAVSFGGNPATSFNPVSSSTITAVVGQGGSGKVTVSTPYTSGSYDGFFFDGAPTISSFTPANAGPGSIITITGSNFTGTQNVTLGGIPAASFTVVNASTLQVTAGASSTGNNITITNLYGTASLGGYAFDSQRPSISFINPAQGATGTLVTITGANFDPAPGNDIVFFGATRSVPTIATANSITVRVPAGATYAPVTVTAGGLTTASSSFFMPTFPGTNATFTDTSFALIDWEGGAGSLDYVALSDLNYDGKPDLAMVNRGFGQGVYTDLNLSTKDTILFPAAGLPQGGEAPFTLAVGDFDGDGKQDVVSTSQDLNAIIVIRNISPDGGNYIGFENQTTYPSGNQPSVVSVADFDGDGKPDIAVTNTLSNTVSIFRNISTAGSIAFSPQQIFTTPLYPVGLAVGDLNGDGKPDLAITTSNGDSSEIAVYTNSSSPGNISFGNRIDRVIGTPLTGIAMGDLDGDGRLDLATVCQFVSGLYILRNTSKNGTTAFASTQLIPTQWEGAVVAIGDLDGDGKPEIVVGNDLQSTLTIYKNTSVPGIPYFAGKVLQASYNVYGLAIGDIDGDGRPEIVNTNDMDLVSTYKNMLPIDTTPPLPVITAFSPDSAYTGTNVSVTGTHLDQVSAISFGGSAAASFVINSPTSITATVGAGSSGSVAGINPIGPASLDGFVFLNAPAPTITAFTPTSGSTGSSVTITGANFINVTAVSFGGSAAATFIVLSPTTIVAIPAAGASGNVSVTAAGGIASLNGFSFTKTTTTTATAAAVITSFSPDSAGTGTTVTILGSGFTNTTAVAFGGVAATSYMIVSDSVIGAVVGVGASGSVSVTSDSGVATKPGFVFTNKANAVTVYPNPAHDEITIGYPSSPNTATLLLINSTGNTLKEIVLPPGTTQISSSVLGEARGVYRIVWQQGSQRLTQTILVL